MRLRWVFTDIVCALSVSNYEKQAKKPSSGDVQGVSAPTEASSPIASQPETSVPEKVEVLRIPIDHSSPSRLNVSTVEIPSGSSLKPGTLESRKLNPETRKLEEQLKHIPNRMETKGVNFRWDRRVLVDKILDDEKISEEKKGRYFMYRCTDADLGLPQNETFTRLKCPRIYGDAFIFRQEGPGFSESGRARFAEMGSARDYEEANSIIFALCYRKDEIDTSREG